MRLTFASDDRVEMLELDESTTVQTVEEILASSVGTSSTKLQWVVNGRVLQTNNKHVTLKMLGLEDGDLVSLIPEMRRPAPTQAGLGRNVRPRTNQPVYFEGMDAHEVLQYNPNPLMAVRVLRQHPEVLRQLGFHNPKLANGISSASTDEAAAEVLRDLLVSNSLNSSLSQIEEEQKEDAMKARLTANPNDEEAKKFMEDKDNMEMIETQRMTMMSEYPETMFPVLMLYIETKINGVRVQSFVDSGAQTSVMTLACAKKCGLDKLIDKRYTGKIVGVGQSVALGKIYIAPIQIDKSFFPMSVTVMESMGDTNMEFLFGLDMLKRHRFSIDLEKGVLTWRGHDNETCSTPFLHEKDLPQHKGGTIGYDPNKQEDDDEEEAVKKALADSEKSEKPASSSMEVETLPPLVPQENINREWEGKVTRLMAMGFSRIAVERVLNQLDGDEETAATCLMFEGGDE